VAVLYRLLYARVLARFDAESVHVLTARALGTLGRIAPGPLHALLRALSGASSPDPRLRVRAFGLEFPSPLGVAAGLDKNLDWFEELGALGFGYVEIGTVTAEPQPGNPRPRIHRLPADRALLNSMGFPNEGAEAAGRRLGRSRHTIVAVNVGRSKVAADAEADYHRSVTLLAPHADLLVLNVSSPNTPGLRDLQAVDVLRGLVQSVRAALRECGAHPPLLVKIAPDLDDEAVDAIADAALELSLDGLVCTNTTISRDGLASPEALTARPGGISGAPLKRRSLEVLRRVRARVGDRLVLVSVGGVEGPDDALARIRAGATLVQAYTGFVYGGPGWPAEINRGLSERLSSIGAESVQDLVGSEARAAAG
jgi:dihydroorotate dehydrogenase